MIKGLLPLQIASYLNMITVNYLDNSPLFKRGGVFGDKAVTYDVRGLCMLLIIFHHIFEKFNLSGFSYPIIGRYLGPGGYLGTGLFFFMSGFGLYFSMSKREKLQITYISNRLLKMCYVYIAAFAVSIIYSMILNDTIEDFGINFITLTIPHSTTWFFKVIVGLYILTFTIFKFNGTRGKSNVLIITIICIIYYIISYKCLPDFWYTSILCFPMGMITAKHRNNFSNTTQLIFAFSFIPCFHYLGNNDTRFIIAITFCYFILFCYRFFNRSFVVLRYIGKHSLCFYLFQLPVLYYSCEILPLNYTYSIAVFITICALALLYTKFIESRVVHLNIRKYKDK